MVSLKLFLLLSPFAVVICSIALFHVIRQKSICSRFLASLIICSAAVLLLSCIEIILKTHKSIMFVSHVTYIFITAGPVIWFMFALTYTGTGKVKVKKLLVLLSIVPLLTTAAAWTNDRFYLIWTKYEIIEYGHFFLNKVYAYGPWFWVHFIYTYGLYFAGFFIIGYEYMHKPYVIARQAVPMLLGISLPIIFNLIYIFRLLPETTRDFSPIVLAISSVLFSVGMNPFKSNEVVSISRNLVYEMVDTPVIIVDTKLHILDLNSRALTMLGWTRKIKTGMSMLPYIISEEHDVVIPIVFTRGSGHLTWVVDGELLKTFVNVSQVHDFEQKTIGYYISIVDIETGGQPPNADQMNLTRREREILMCIKKQMTNKEIADRLCVSESTIKSHVHNLLKKTGARSRDNFKL